jgi:O-antigen/teichoic acid export membrane protein
MVITIQAITALFASVGIPLALIKYVAEFKDAREKLFQTTSAAFIGSIVFGLVVGILLYMLSGTFAGLFHMPELARLLKILAFAFPAASIFETLLGLFNGLRQMKTYAYVMVLRNFLMALFVVAFVWFGFGVEGAVWGIVLSVLGGCIFGLYRSRKFLHLTLHGLLQGAKKLVSFGSQVFVANALGLILAYTDILLIGYFLAAEDVGYYSVAVSLSTFFLLVPQAIQRITYPATSEYWSQNNRQALSRMIDKSMQYSACILLPLGLGVGFFAQDLVVGIFGQEFRDAAWPLCVLLIARVITGSTNVPIGLSFSGVGRPDIPLKISAIIAAANVGLNVLFIPLWGILGAAIATTVSSLLGLIIFLALMPRILGVTIDIKWFARAFGFACVGITLFSVGIRLINPYMVGGVILCAYTALVFWVFLTGEDKTILKSLASPLAPRR